MSRRYGDPIRLMRNGERTKNWYSKVRDSETGLDSYVSTRTANKRTATAWIEARRLEEGLGPEGRARARQREMSFEDACGIWRQDQESRVSSKRYETIRLVADKFWRAFFGKQRLSEIESSDIRRYLTHRSKGTIPGAKTLKAISPSTLNNDLGTLKSFFNFAVDEDWIMRSPAARVKPLPTTMKRRTRYLSLEEEEGLLRACREGGTVTAIGKRNGGGCKSSRKRTRRVKWEQTVTVPLHLYPITMIALRCGLRRKTILSLTWAHVDWKNSRWSLPAEVMKAGRDFTAPIPESVLEALREYRELVGTESDATRRLQKDATIFGLNSGSSVTKSFKSAASRAGLPTLTFHDCRRCFVNRCREKGIAVDVAMALSDHRDIGTFLRHYREVSESERTEAVANLDDAWREVTA